MSWFSKSKPAGQKIEPAELQTLQIEVDRLQSETARLQASLAEADRQRDVARSETEQTLSNERQLMSENHLELHGKIQELESNLVSERQKITLLDEANVTMAEMVKDRDQQIETHQQTGHRELQNRDSKLELQEQRLSEFQFEISTISKRSESQIADLTQQLNDANERTSVQVREIEKGAAASFAEAATKIADLEKQLAESEARSKQRADQRSALLRNMTEIHRLSMTSSKVEGPENSLKIIDSDAMERNPQMADRSATDSIASPIHYQMWNNYGEVESA